MGIVKSKPPQVGSLATCRSLTLGTIFLWLLHDAPVQDSPLPHRAQLDQACLTGGDIHQLKPDHALVAFTDMSEVLRAVVDPTS